MRIFFNCEKRRPRNPIECEYCSLLLNNWYFRVTEIHKEEGLSHKNRQYNHYKLCSECVEIAKNLNDRFCEENKIDCFDSRFFKI